MKSTCVEKSNKTDEQNTGFWPINNYIFHLGNIIFNKKRQKRDKNQQILCFTRMKNYISFFILLILANLAAKAQEEPLFSNYMLMRSVANQSFSGAEKTINAIFCNRTMFAGFGEGKPVTSVFGVEAPVEMFGTSSGIGILLMNDKIGMQQDVKISLAYSYHHKLETGTLGMGFSLGLNNYSISPEWEFPSGDDEYFSWVDSGDELIPEQFSTILFTLGLGAYYETSKYYLGLYVSNINRAEPKDINASGQEFIYGFYPTNFNLSGAYNIELPDPLFDLRPSFIYRTDLAAMMLDLNATVFYKKRYYAGVGARFSPANIAAFTMLAGTELFNGLNFGYAFDLNLGGMFGQGATSHEILVTYSFNIDRKRDMKYKSVRYL
jgi:type IX secretion system PorP/SprF family membrane protein